MIAVEKMDNMGMLETGKSKFYKKNYPFSVLHPSFS